MNNTDILKKEFIINVITNVIKEVNSIVELLSKNEHFSGGFKLSTLQKELVQFLTDLQKTEKSDGMAETDKV